MTENDPPAGSSSRAQRPGPMSVRLVPDRAAELEAAPRGSVAVGRRDVDHPVRLGSLRPARRPSRSHRRPAARRASRWCTGRRRTPPPGRSSRRPGRRTRVRPRCLASSARTRSACPARRAPRSRGAAPPARPTPGLRPGRAALPCGRRRARPSRPSRPRRRLRSRRRTSHPRLRSQRTSTSWKRPCRPRRAPGRRPAGLRAAACGSRPRSRSAHVAVQPKSSQ